MSDHQHVVQTSNEGTSFCIICELESRLREAEAEVERLQGDAAYGRTAMDRYGIVQMERDRLRELLDECKRAALSNGREIVRLRKALERIAAASGTTVLSIDAPAIARQALEGTDRELPT